MHTLIIGASPSHMAKLFDICVSKAKVWREFPNGSHNDTVAEPLYFEYIEDFLRSHVLRRPSPEKSPQSKV